VAHRSILARLCGDTDERPMLRRIRDSFLTRRGEVEIVNFLAAALWGLLLLLSDDPPHMPALLLMRGLLPDPVWGCLFLAWAAAIYLAWYCRAWTCQRVGLFVGVLVWPGAAFNDWVYTGQPGSESLLYIALLLGCMWAFLRLKVRGDVVA